MKRHESKKPWDLGCLLGLPELAWNRKLAEREGFEPQIKIQWINNLLNPPEIGSLESPVGPGFGNRFGNRVFDCLIPNVRWCVHLREAGIPHSR